MMQKSEERISTKLMTFLLPTDMQKWQMNVKRVIKSLKKDQSDDYDTDYVDVDSLLNMYVDYFRVFKKAQQKKLSKQYHRVLSSSSENHTETSIDNVASIMLSAIPKT